MIPINLFRLRSSRSQRVLWLLEELAIPYELVVHQWDKNRAPQDMFQVHPLGKVPVVEVKDDLSLVPTLKLAETGHILEYFCEHHDKKGKLAPATEDDREKVNYFLHYAEGSFQWLLMTIHVNSLAHARLPWYARGMVLAVVKRLNRGFYYAEVAKNLSFLETIMAAQHSQGSKYFVGQKLSAADIILVFPLYEELFHSKNPEKFLGNAAKNMAKEYPHLKLWTDDMSAEPGFLKAYAVTASA